MNFGQQIKAAREAKDMRQEDLAQALGVTQQAVQKWEAMEAAPTRSPFLQPLCDFLGLELPEQTRHINRRMIAHPSAEAIYDEERGQYEPPPVLRRSIRDVPRRPPSALPSTDEVLAMLQEAMPEDLQRNVRQIVLVGDKPYPFSYCSQRVIAHIVQGNPNGVSSMLFRVAAWRMAMACIVNNDTQIPNRHYVLVSLAPPHGSPETFRVSAQLKKEAGLMNFQVIEAPDIPTVVDRIRRLEDTPTEFDEFVEQHQDVLRQSPDEDFGDLL